MTVLCLIPQATSYVVGLVEFCCFFPPSPPKKYITPTLIPPAARGKFEPEWQTKNHYVDELAPLNRYLFTYLLVPCDLRDIKQRTIAPSNWFEWKEEGGTKFSVIWISFIILLYEKFLQFDWLRAVVFQLNLKYLHVKITVSMVIKITKQIQKQ